MIIWLASGNDHKRKELAAVLAGHELRLPGEGSVSGFDPEETGRSFAENALIKARALYTLLEGAGLTGPVLADDSGLCVDALGGRPGIYSARYAGPGGPETGGGSGGLTAGRLSPEERNLLLLGELAALPAGTPRGARFVCAMVLLWDAERFYLVQETLEGEIVSGPEAIRGGGGFGYDPIMYIPALGKTVAELSGEEKNRLSHRGKAGRTIAALIDNR
jgi:XTP/dITP diphosphohydrolase